jgi:hypothetical protein
MGWALRALLTAFVVIGCGGETIEGTSAGGSPPTNIGRDGGRTSDASSEGGVPDPADYERSRSGTRLTVTEPSPGHPTLWDRDKNIRCVPRLATDGTTRCLPDWSNSALFSDSLCTHAVISPTSDDCGVSSRYYLDSDRVALCGTGKTTVYTAGAPIDTPQAVYPHDGSPCSLADQSMVQPGPFYEAVVSDPTEWVELTTEMVPVTEALGVVVWVGTDGSRLPYGLRLLASAKPCDAYPPPQEPAPLHTWCIPSLRARPGDGFPTDQCTGEHLAGACEPTNVIEAPTDLLETGATVSTVFFQNPLENLKCMTLPPAFTSAPNPSFYYLSGPPLQRDQYPALELTRQGSGRVQAEYWTNNGKNLFVVSYYDTKYGDRCIPTEFASGGTWCVRGTTIPFTPRIAYHVYADPECTRELTVTAAGPSPNNEKPLGLVYPSGHSCTSWELPTLHSLQEYRGPTFMFSATGCQPSQSQNPPDMQMMEPGAAVDPSSAFGAVPDWTP